MGAGVRRPGDVVVAMVVRQKLPREGTRLPPPGRGGAVPQSIACTLHDNVFPTPAVAAESRASATGTGRGA